MNVNIKPTSGGGQFTSEIKVPSDNVTSSNRVTFDQKPERTEVKPQATIGAKGASAPAGSSDTTTKKGSGLKKPELDKKVDLLSLKQQVVEEIKSELQLVGNNRPQVGNLNYVDPFSRLDAQ